MKLQTLIAIICALLLAVPTVADIPPSDVIYSWNSNEKIIALTFDDGPHPKRTKEILDILDEYGIKATFFFIGQNVVDYPDAVPLVQAAGHEIGNHTFSHRNLQTLDYASLCSEIDRTEAAVEDMIEYRTRLLRPPEGKFSDTVLEAARERDYSVICWSVDTLDWAHNPPENIAQNVLSSVEAGDIILFHDFVSGESPTPAALRMIIPPLLEQGYRFVTVSELLSGD